MKIFFKAEYGKPWAVRIPIWFVFSIIIIAIAAIRFTKPTTAIKLNIYMQANVEWISTQKTLRVFLSKFQNKMDILLH